MLQLVLECSRLLDEQRTPTCFLVQIRVVLVLRHHFVHQVELVMLVRSFGRSENPVLSGHPLLSSPDAAIVHLVFHYKSIIK